MCAWHQICNNNYLFYNNNNNNNNYYYYNTYYDHNYPKNNNNNFHININNDTVSTITVRAPSNIQNMLTLTIPETFITGLDKELQVMAGLLSFVLILVPATVVNILT